MPRVITGTAGGLQLKAPKGLETRPTADKTKEAIFSSLGAQLVFEGLDVLELYAGSGQLGIEALSRGAASALFVEQNRKTANLIRENLVHCRLEARGRVLAQRSESVVDRLLKENKGFDLILADPPYALAQGALQRLLPALEELLKEEGVLVWEMASRTDMPEFVTKLKRRKCCHYGAAMVLFYTKTSER